MAEAFSWEGLDGVRANIERVKAARVKGGRRGLLLGAQIVLQASNQRVPHETGDLERDGGISADGDTVAISYGRSAQTRDYAVPQHERMDLHHDSGRSAKFLENALNSTRDQVAEVLAQSIRSETGA